MSKLAQEMVDSVFSFGELGFQEFETSKYLTGQLEKFGFKVQRGFGGIPTAWVATWGSGQAGDRARLRHRRHSAGVAEAGRRVSRSDHRRRAGSRRGPQHRHAAEHPRGDRGEEDHGARQAAGHADAVAGRRRGARRHQGLVSCATACSRTSTSALFTHVGNNLGVSWGAGGGTGLVSVEYHVRGRDRAQRGRTVARPVSARRRRADERRLAVPPRAPAPLAALALGHHQRRRPAERRPAQRHASGSTSARSISRTSRSSGRSATRWPRAPR